MNSNGNGRSLIHLVEIELDKIRHLKLSWGAIEGAEADMRRQWGERISFSEAMSGRVQSTNLEIIMFHALRHEDDELTRDALKDMMLPHRINYYIDQVSNAWLEQTPTPVDSGKKETDRPPESTGSSSGP